MEIKRERAFTDTATLNQIALSTMRFLDDELEKRNIMTTSHRICILEMMKTTFILNHIQELSR